MGRVFVVRVENNNSQLRHHGQRLLQKQADRGRLADAGRSQNSKVPPHQFADVNLRRDILVLAQPADLDALPAAKSVDGSEIICADSVRRRAQRGKRAHATMEKRRAIGIVDNFAVQLNCDPGGVGLVFGPSAVIGRNFANSAHQTRGPVNDRNEMANRPLLFVQLERAADDALCSVQSHQSANDARWLQLSLLER